MNNPIQKPMNVSEGQVCKACDTFKPFSEYRKSSRFKDGHLSRCTDCINAAQREYYSRNKDRIKAKEREYRAKEDPTLRRERHLSATLKRVYGISKDEFYVMLKSQHGCCKICQKVLKRGPGGASVDHCHKTGYVRGILCQKCNAGLGMFEDTPEFLIAAAAYLRVRK